MKIMRMDFEGLSMIYTDEGLDLWDKLDKYLSFLHQNDCVETELWFEEKLGPVDPTFDGGEKYFKRINDIFNHCSKFDIISNALIYKKDRKNNYERIAVIPWNDLVLKKDFADIKLNWYYCKREQGLLTLVDNTIADIGTSMKCAQDFILCYRKERKL